MPLLEKHLRVAVDGYDLAAERERYRFDDVTVGGLSLNRGRALVEVGGDMNAARLEEVKRRHADAIFPNTVTPESPVIELGYPQAGHYVRCDAGTYFDAYLGVAQKLFDENHPAYARMIQALVKQGLLLRREINTDDFFVARRGAEGVRTPQELAALVNGEAARAFAKGGAKDAGWKTFFSNSGTEAIEAGLKIACRVAHARLLERHGADVEAELMRQLGIPRFSKYVTRRRSTRTTRSSSSRARWPSTAARSARSTSPSARRCTSAASRTGAALGTCPSTGRSPTSRRSSIRARFPRS